MEDSNFGKSGAFFHGHSFNDPYSSNENQTKYPGGKEETDRGKCKTISKRFVIETPTVVRTVWSEWVPGYTQRGIARTFGHVQTLCPATMLRVVVHEHVVRDGQEGSVHSHLGCDYNLEAKVSYKIYPVELLANSNAPGICAYPLDFRHSSDSSGCTSGRISRRTCNGRSNKRMIGD